MNIDWPLALLSTPAIFALGVVTTLIFLWVSGGLAGRLEKKMREDDKKK